MDQNDIIEKLVERIRVEREMRRYDMDIVHEVVELHSRGLITFDTTIQRLWYLEGGLEYQTDTVTRRLDLSENSFINII